MFPNGNNSIADPFIHDERIYREVVQKMPISCTDVVLLCRNERGRVARKIYLAKRAIYPMKGIWVVGGRMFFNDQSFEESAFRSIKRETALVIRPERLKPVATNYYAWARTKQGDFPGKNVALTFLCVLTRGELEQATTSLDESEYDLAFGLQAYSRARLVEEGCHPMLIDLFDEIFPSQGARQKMTRRAGRPLWSR